jgi:hypothetical protein
MAPSQIRRARSTRFHPFASWSKLTRGLSQIGCLPCGPGRFSTAGRSSCTFCSPGTFQPNSSATACASCGLVRPSLSRRLHWCTATHSSIFALWLLGSVHGLPRAVGVRYAFVLLLAPRISSLLLLIFRFCFPLSDDCPVGTFNPGTGQGGCTPCPRGQFQDETGRSACLLCPPGSFQSRFGNTTCEVCPLGRFALSSGTPECEPCDFGRYADTTNSSQCLSCPAGRQQNLQGASTCLVCRPVSHLLLTTRHHPTRLRSFMSGGCRARFPRKAQWRALGARAIQWLRCPAHLRAWLVQATISRTAI